MNHKTIELNHCTIGDITCAENTKTSWKQFIKHSPLFLCTFLRYWHFIQRLPSTATWFYTSFYVSEATPNTATQTCDFSGLDQNYGQRDF